jgi:hypothetical protein
MDGTLIALQRRFNPSNETNPTLEAPVPNERSPPAQVQPISGDIPSVMEPQVGPPPVVIAWTLRGRRLKTLVDSGSTVDLLSSRAVFFLRLGLRELENVLSLNLGTHGARSKTQHWCVADFMWEHLTLPGHRFFVAPLGGYDVILGTPFLARVGAMVGVSPSRLSFADGREILVDPWTPAVAKSRVSVPSHGLVSTLTPVDDAIAMEPLSTQNLLAQGYQRGDLSPSEVDSMVCAMVADFHRAEQEADETPYIEEATQRILTDYADVFPDTLPHGLPPLREVNHRITLIDPNKKLRPKTYSIPLKYEQQIRDQVNAYCDSDWFFPMATDDAVPAFTVPKKDPTQGRLVVDLRERNANTVRDESPIPDMRAVRERVARHKYRSQFDFTKSYNQIRIEPESVKNSAFKLPFGTFGSNVMHMGDLNAPATLHRLLFTMFCHHIGKFIDVFFDNVFQVVYSDDPREHVRHVRTLLDILRTHRFYLNPGDVELFSKEMTALGALINDEGILVEGKRIDKIRDWPTPKEKQDILRFMGTVQWVADHYPYLAIVAAPLTELTGNVPFEWTDLHEEAFRAIKEIVPRVLVPIDWAQVQANNWTVFVVSDACLFGCAAWIGMGPSLKEARPARYHSHKFNRAQRNYFTTEQELLGIVDAIEAFQDLLIGYKFVVATDHQPLKHFWTQ